jgi:hypothetical protein
VLSHIAKFSRLLRPIGPVWEFITVRAVGTQTDDNVVCTRAHKPRIEYGGIPPTKRNTTADTTEAG